MVEPTREEVLTSLAEEREEDPDKIRALADARLASVEVSGRQEFFELRKKWSFYIASWISILVVFNGFLAWMVGAGVWDFREYEWFITAVTVETFLQVVGMGYVAVRFLFSDGKS